MATPNHATLPWMRHAPHWTQSNKRNTALDRCRTCQTPVSSSHSSSSSFVSTLAFARLRRRGPQQRRDPLDVLAVHEGVVVEQTLD